MRCKECGYMNDDQVTSCIKCGTELEKKLSEPVAEAPAKETDAEGNKTVQIKQEGEGTPTVKLDMNQPPASGIPTIKGKPVDSEPWNGDRNKPGERKSEEKKHTYFTCSSCQYYPLQEPPSALQPCPNCGFGAVKVKSPAPGTQKLSDINLGEPEYQVVLIDGDSKKVFELKDGETRVNRENLDENNKAISSDKHALFHLENGELFLNDESSNGATFIQVNGKVKVESGMKIILGNKIVEVRLEEK
ncbi:MAG: hypothetical protein GC180_03805 [Bacteroidetes bacterium]|nr:hypothetical protein [Bacteroidota bacterium]